MISKKDLNEFEFETMQDYFEYILNSEINGQRSQVRELIKNMSKGQQKEALQYFETAYDQVEIADHDITQIKNLILEAI